MVILQKWKFKVKSCCRKHMLFAKCLAIFKYIILSVSRTKGKKIEREICIYKNNLNAKEYNKILRDILFCNLYYNVNTSEYFLFGFERLSHMGRQEYIGDASVLEVCDKITNTELASNFRDKYKAYLNFKSFYKREVVQINGEIEAKDKVLDFITRHNSFIIKPLDQSKGKDVIKVDINEENFILENVISVITRLGKCLIEEEIITAGVLKEIHPASVNTIRFVTYVNKKKEVIPLYSFMRVGRGNKCVDNISSGGLFANVDLNTGIVSSPAFDLYGKKYIKHPDTDVQVLGQVMPRWNELKQIASEVAQIIPEQKLVGWDFAYTNDGWVIVEANHRPASRGVQISSGHGIREVIESTLIAELN